MTQTAPADDSILATIIALTADLKGLPDGRVGAATLFSHLGVDSLDLMELVMAIESEFSVGISDADIAAATCPADLAAAVAQLTARPRGPVDNPALYRDADADGEAVTNTRKAS